MSEKKMTTKQTEVWLIGQYVMAQAITEALDSDVSIDIIMKQCLAQIAEAARNNGQMGLFFEAIELRNSYIGEERSAVIGGTDLHAQIAKTAEAIIVN